MEARAEKKARRQAKPSPNDEVSEAQIAVHWQEQNYFAPPKDFVAQAYLTEKGVFKRFALEKFPGYYKEFAELLDWYKKWDKIFDGSKPPFWRWFVGGKINASYNCIDRHLAKHRNKTAIHFVPERINFRRLISKAVARVVPSFPSASWRKGNAPMRRWCSRSRTGRTHTSRSAFRWWTRAGGRSGWAAS